MNPPPPPDPDLTTRALDVAEWITKLAAGLAAAWALVEKIAKPYHAWRREKLSADIHLALAKELGTLNELAQTAERIELVLERQSAFYEDIDAFLRIVQIHTDRLDETNDLLDALGFRSVDRRIDDDQRKEFTALVATLLQRQTARKRHETTIEHPVVGDADL